MSALPERLLDQGHSFGTAFMAWLIVEAQDIFADVTVSLADGRLVVGLRRFPDLRCSFDPDAVFVAAVQAGDCWDIVFERNCLAIFPDHEASCFCGLCDDHRLFADEEALWRDHLFEPFRRWVLSDIVPASRLDFRRYGGVTTATLRS